MQTFSAIFSLESASPRGCLALHLPFQRDLIGPPCPFPQPISIWVVPKQLGGKVSNFPGRRVWHVWSFWQPIHTLLTANPPNRPIDGEIHRLAVAELFHMGNIFSLSLTRIPPSMSTKPVETPWLGIRSESSDACQVRAWPSVHTADGALDLQQGQSRVDVGTGVRQNR